MGDATHVEFCCLEAPSDANRYINAEGLLLGTVEPWMARRPWQTMADHGRLWRQKCIFVRCALGPAPEF